MPTSLESQYMRLDDDQLAAIAHSEDYRPDARALAKALLLRRNLSEEEIDQWRDPTAEFADLPWAIGKSESDLRRMFKRRKLFSTLENVIICVPIAFEILIQSIQPDLASFIFFWYMWLWYLILIRFFLHLIFYWRTPIKILLLRPFEFPKSRKSMRRFARNYLRFFGHTYTISDASVKPRVAFLETLQFFLVFISLWLLFAFRPYFKVKSNEHVPNLKEFINRRFARNIAWALSWDKLFKVSCVPECWQRTVQHLINSSQLIVVDLSRAGQGLRWELEEVRFYSATAKIVFVSHRDCLDSAKIFLESIGWRESYNVFAYGDEGLACKHAELIVTLASTAASSLTRPLIAQPTV